MLPMPDAVAHGEATGGKRRRSPDITAEDEKSDDDVALFPTPARRFVYQRRTFEDMVNRIRNMERAYPRPARHSGFDPEAYFVEADGEDYWPNPAAA